MKKRFVVLFLLCILILESVVAFAIGISPTSVPLPYAPGEYHNVSFTIINSGSEDINVSLFPGHEKGVSATIQDSSFVISPFDRHQVTVGVTFLDDAEPGDHSLSLFAKEEPLGDITGITAFGQVKGTITYSVPYPGTYATLSLNGHNSNTDEPIVFTLQAHNLGKRDISSFVTTLVIEDEEGKVYDTYTHSITSFGVGETKEHLFTLDTNSYTAGEYIARASGKYQAITTPEALFTFNIGHLYVALLDVYLEPFPNNLYKATLSLENQWNSPLDHVYATLDLFDDDALLTSVTTPSLHLQPWEKGTLSSFWDIQQAPPGTYQLKITLHYNDQATVHVEPFDIGTLPREWSSMLTILLVVFVIIVIDYIWLRRKRRSKPYEKYTL
jgi:hypothetical protein